MSREEEQYIMVLMLQYTIVYGESPITPKVDKYLKRIKSFLMRLTRRDNEAYHRLSKESHETFERVKRELVDVNDVQLISQAQFHNTLYSGLRGNVYKNLAYTEKIVNNAIQSFYGASKHEIIDYEQNSIKMAKLFLKYIGIKPDDRLSKLKYTLIQNKIMDGRA